MANARHNSGWMFLVITIIFLPVIGFSIAGYWSDYRQQVNQAQELASAVARSADERMVGSLRSIDLLLQYVARFATVRGVLSGEIIERTLILQAAAMPEIEMLLITDADGRRRAASMRNTSFADVSHYQFFSVQKDIFPNPRVVIDGPLKQQGEPPVIVISRPISDQNGHFKGVAAAVLSPQFFSTPMQQMATNRIAHATLMNSNGILLSNFPYSVGHIGDNLRDSDQFKRIPIGPQSGAIQTDPKLWELPYPMTNDEHIVAWRRVRDYPLIITISIHGKDVRQAWLDATIPKLVMEGGLIILLAYLARLLYKRGKALSSTAMQLSNLNKELEDRVAHRTETLAREVRRREAIEAELVLAKDRAETASHTKSRFLAVASHDIRQPVQALNLYANVLHGHSLPDASYDIVTKIRRSAASLAELLDSLLDISRLDAGIVTPSLTQVRLAPLMMRIWEDFTPQAEAKQISLTVVLSECIVISDSTLLSRILQNLISNAIRYTPVGGKILVGCRKRGHGQIVLQVIDTGIGIPAAQHSRIFEEFTQVEGKTADNRRQGLGLGLAIVRRLCKLLDHDLDVHSRLNQGSRFEVHLPVAEIPLHGDENTPALSGHSDITTILIIDDEPDIGQSLSLQLDAWGYKTLVATTPEAAFTLFKTYPIGGIIADHGISEKANGIDVCRSILQQSERDVPVIILTGDTRKERFTDAQRAGFILAHKPIGIQDLQTLVSSTFG